MTPEQEEDLDEFVRVRVEPGFLDLEELEADVRDWAEDRNVDTGSVRAILHEQWRRRTAIEHTWTDTGDFGRLSAAFAELGVAGVLGRMSYACCAACAVDRIGGKRTPDGDGGYCEWAYVYFHEEDAERLVGAESELRLGFGSFAESYGSSDSMAGVVVVDALVRNGFDVTWSGDPADRIAVSIDVAKAVARVGMIPRRAGTT